MEPSSKPTPHSMQPVEGPKDSPEKLFESSSPPVATAVPIMHVGPEDEMNLFSPTVTPAHQQTDSQIDTRSQGREESIIPRSPPKSQNSGKYFGSSVVKRWVRRLGKKTRQHLTMLFSDDDDVDANAARGTVASTDPAINLTGIGLLHVFINCATWFNVTDAAEGDLFVECRIENSGVLEKSATEARTRTVRNSATPQFNKNWTFGLPHFRCVLKLSLINARDGSIVGSARISLYSVIMRDADRYNATWEAAGEQNYLLFNTENASAHTAATGSIKARINFQENWQGLYINFIPIAAAEPPQEPFSMERLSKHVGRFQAAIDVFVFMYNEYCRLMNWEDVVVTSICLVVFVYTTLTINAEYALCCPAFLLVLFATLSRFRRFQGQYRRAIIENIRGPPDPYRPVGSLRVSVGDWRIRGNVGNNGKRPRVDMFFHPMPESGMSNVRKAEYDRIHFVGSIDSEPVRTHGIFGILADDNKVGRESIIQNISDPIAATSDSDSIRKEKICLVYPVLQALTVYQQLLPWSANTSVLKLAVFRDRSSYCGFVAVRLQEVVAGGGKLAGWCRLCVEESVQVSIIPSRLLLIEYMFQGNGLLDEMTLLESTVFNPSNRVPETDFNKLVQLERPEFFEHFENDDSDWIQIQIDFAIP